MSKEIIFSNGHWTITEKRKPFEMDGVLGVIVELDLCNKGVMCKSASFFAPNYKTEGSIKKDIERHVVFIFKSLENTAKTLREEFYLSPVTS